jgi:hypothetical protein
MLFYTLQKINLDDDGANGAPSSKVHGDHLIIMEHQI